MFPNKTDSDSRFNLILMSFEDSSYELEFDAFYRFLFLQIIFV